MTAHDKTSHTASVKKKLKEESEEPSSTETLEKSSYEELEKKLAEAEEKANYSWERMLRVQADMDNMQRRTERDIANAHKYALEKFVLELLPIIDGLERALDAHQNEESGSGSLLDGVKMTLKMLYAALEKVNVSQVNPVSEAFNPEFHQAVSTQPDPNLKPNTVVSVLQKGYLLNGRLVRPALVVVSKA